MISNDVVVCTLVAESPKPSVPSFNVGCDACGARVWVSHEAPLEPTRLCPACAKALMGSNDNIVEMVSYR